MKPISTDQVLRRLEIENPWWREPHEVPPVYQRWTPRPYHDLFFPLVHGSTVRRAVVLMGPRRVGKTVLIHHAVQRLLAAGVPPRRIAYVSVDHPLYNGLSLGELVERVSAAAGIDLADGPAYLFFDEIQYHREWEIHLKHLVDDHPELKLVASGSAAAALKLKSRESGAGRFTEFLLPPLTFYEYLELLGGGNLVSYSEAEGIQVRDIKELNRHFLHYLNFGGYPEVALSKEIQEDPGRFVKADIIDKVLLRDLPSLYGIQDVQELNSLFTTLAYNTAQEVSLDGLSKSSHVAKNTLKKYIEYLEAAFLIRVVHRIDRSARRFQRANHFKVYLTTPSIYAALFAPVGADDPEIGALVETAVFAQYFHFDFFDVYYARWPKGEVDLVVQGAGKAPALALEVKWSDRIVDQPRELQALLDFCLKHRVPDPQVTTRSRGEVRELSGLKMVFAPAALYCWIFGVVAIAGKFLPTSTELIHRLGAGTQSPRGGDGGR